MTIAGWLFLGVAWSVVIGLAAFCIVKTIRQD